MSGDRMTGQQRCDDCGEFTFFNHSMSSSGPDGWRHTHGDCEAAAEALRWMPVIYGQAIQSLVEIGDALGRFICEADLEEYESVARLHQLVHDAYATALDGIRAEEHARKLMEAADACS
jgi:hypothetical protein